MTDETFSTTVFVNCPFDEEYEPLLEVIIFCAVRLGFLPRLASDRIEAGENRLDKIVQIIGSAKYSIHDLSRCRSSAPNEFFRMNMPFEFGIDVGLRRIGFGSLSEKKFLIFEATQYDLKQAISDIAGQDVEYHNCDYEMVMRKVRNFFRVEGGVHAPGPSKLLTDYVTFQGWMTEKKIHEGHSEDDAMNLPTRERLDEMKLWVELDRPTSFTPP